MRQLARRLAPDRAPPTEVVAFVLADLRVLGRVHGDAAQVEDLDLEYVAAPHRLVGAGIERGEAGQSHDPAAELGEARTLPLDRAAERAAAVHGQLLRTRHERREVALPQDVGEHARQIDVPRLVRGEHIVARGRLVRARQVLLRPGEEVGLLPLHLREEDRLVALEDEQRSADKRKRGQARQREVARQAKAFGAVGRRGAAPRRQEPDPTCNPRHLAAPTAAAPVMTVRIVRDARTKSTEAHPPSVDGKMPISTGACAAVAQTARDCRVRRGRGGWYRVRTCDPCRVKAVLYR
ncbi:MAG: hypothetical protein OHK0044_14320 [Burkholderiaceae bacterium]